MFDAGKKLAYITVCHTVYRICGEHTIEMIKAFSDFEYKVVGNNRSLLLPKLESTSTDPKLGTVAATGGSSSVGIAAFVEAREKCGKCNSPMTVVRSKKGKV